MTNKFILNSPDPKDDEDLLSKIFLHDFDNWDPCDWSDPRNCDSVDEVFEEDDNQNNNQD